MKIESADLLGLEQLQNVFGLLSPEVKGRLVAVFENPTNETWDKAYSIVLRSGSGFGLGMTLWQAWIATDDAAPRLGPSSTLHSKRRAKWDKVPTQGQIFTAIRHAATTLVQQA